MKHASKVRKNIFVGVSAALISSAALACSLSSSAPPRWQPQSLGPYLQSLVDGRRIKGIAVALTSPQGECFLSAGESGLAARPGIYPDSFFEIGSITKGLTGTLLADLVSRGELRVDDAIGPMLPPQLRANDSLAAVTYRQLATHTSGIPRVPMTQGAFLRAFVKNPEDPYHAYSRASFEEYLAGLQLRRGETPEYSNSGLALLGWLLGRRLDMSYEQALVERVLKPLKLEDIAFNLKPEQATRMVQGFNEKLKPTAAWNTEVFAPAGGLRATPHALLQLSKRMIEGGEPWKTAQTPLLATSKSRLSASGWAILRRMAAPSDAPRELIWHNGGTFGASSFLGVDRQAKLGVVVLINTGATDLADEVGLYLWDPQAPQPQSSVPTAWERFKAAVKAL